MASHSRKTSIIKDQLNFREFISNITDSLTFILTQYPSVSMLENSFAKKSTF